MGFFSDSLGMRALPSGMGHNFLNLKTQGFFVNGTSIPQVNFDIGDSYAGNLSNKPSGNSSLFFWFFPSENPDAVDEITVWLNGGPGCSSLTGFLQENGPISWKPGTYGPVPNPYSWTHLTNMVWIDQPAGTGFSPGPSTVTNEVDVADQFMDFWKNFFDLFNLHGRKIYFTGESYAGQYIPYIASQMLDENDERYFKVAGVQLIDPWMNDMGVIVEAPAVAALNHFKSIFALNDSFMLDINNRADECGYTNFLQEALTYPPVDTPLSPAPSPNEPGCKIRDSIMSAVSYVNPCFNLEHLTDSCPEPWDVMDSEGPVNYFNNSSVQEAIHAPKTEYKACRGKFFQMTKTVPS